MSIKHRIQATKDLASEVSVCICACTAYINTLLTDVVYHHDLEMSTMQKKVYNINESIRQQDITNQNAAAELTAINRKVDLILERLGMRDQEGQQTEQQLQELVPDSELTEDQKKVYEDVRNQVRTYTYILYSDI